MDETRGLLQLNDEVLRELELPCFFPMLLVLPDKTLCLNEAARELFRTSLSGQDSAGRALARAFRAQGLLDLAEGYTCHTSPPVKGELALDIPGIAVSWVEIRGKVVRYNGELGLLTQMVDVSAKHVIAEELSRLSKLREIMLSVTQNIIRVDTVEEMCQLVLQSALSAMTQASLGSIMLRDEGDIMKIASYIGFNDSVKNFSLPLARTLYYRASKGKLDGVVNIPDLATIGAYHLIPTAYGEGVYIKSAIAAPIMVQGELFGIISVDAVETHAFDEDDEKSMTFLRDNIEIAVENHLLYKEKAFLASYDRLTGLHNRGFFEEHFGPVMERAKRYKESFCVALFDVDGLKAVNDTHGHLAGDGVLRTSAANLRRAIPKSDVLARYGGDEIVGLFLETDEQSLSARLEGILNDMEATQIILGGRPYKCRMTYGISQYPVDGESIDELIWHADQRMYKLK
ncbi:MAG TPA: sensor domain-containing diguanylate cyclase [Bacillota bacterium]|nr:sensor domain-containing diguanylate cyclase [Bacillota bacterium]